MTAKEIITHIEGTLRAHAKYTPGGYNSKEYQAVKDVYNMIASEARREKFYTELLNELEK